MPDPMAPAEAFHYAAQAALAGVAALAGFALVLVPAAALLALCWRASGGAAGWLRTRRVGRAARRAAARR